MKYFTEIDLEDAFLQLKLREQDINVLSFTFEGVQYVFQGAIYGLKIISNVFQRTMSSLLADLPFAKVYIDNITVASKTWSEHTVQVRKVLERLTQLNIRISPKKLLIGRRSIRILGRRITESGVEADPVKVNKILKWPFPADHKALQAFLGTVNYLRPHIRQCAELEAAFNKARVSQEAFEREADLNKESLARNFKLLKEAIATAPLLRYPDVDRPFHLATDASRVGVGAVLYQPSLEQQELGDTSVTAENIVAITSRSLKAYERNYATYKLELLAIINALKEFREFLYGRTFSLHTDHRALIYLFDNGKLKAPHPTLAGWSSEISEFDFSITHVPGYINCLPDHLSRLYSKADAWGVPNNWTSHMYATKVEEKSHEHASSAPLPTLHAKYPTLKEALSKEELMKSLGKTIPDPSEYSKIIKKAHERGHYGIKATVEWIYRGLNLWWPNMRDTVAKAISHCKPCQKHSIRKQGFHALSSPSTPLPWDWLQVDIIEMPTSLLGNSYILSVIDLFSSYLVVKPMKTKSMEEAASEIYKIWSDFGFPKILQSDGGKEFCNRIIKEIAKKFNIELKISTPYYKRSTGSVERVNQTISQSLRKMLLGQTAMWDTLLPACQYYYNNTVRTLTKSSPFNILFTRATNEEISIVDDEDSDWFTSNDYSLWAPETQEAWLQWRESQKRVLDMVYPELQEQIANKRAKTATKFGKKHKPVPPLAIGTQVLALNTTKERKWGDQNYVGPYVVTKQHETGSYDITDEQGQTLHRARNQLKPIPAEAADEETEEKQSFVVERIIRSRADHTDRQQYLVKWKDYPHSQNSWVDAKDFDDEAIIHEFWKMKAPSRSTKRKPPNDQPKRKSFRKRTPKKGRSA